MARTSTKSAAMLVAMGMVSFGLQQFQAGNVFVAGIAVLMGIVIGGGYQLIEDTDHKRVYNDIVDAIGEENFREIADMSGDEIRRLRKQVQNQDE